VCLLWVWALALLSQDGRRPAGAASGRRQCEAEDRTGHECVCGDDLQKEQDALSDRSSQLQLPAGWFCDEESAGALWHQNVVAMRDNVQEDQIRHKLGTKLSYRYTTNSSKRTHPSRNGQIQKAKSSRRPWNVDESSEKQKVTNSSHRALEGRACSGRLPQLASRCLGDSLILEALSHQPLRGSSR
jgi:hypothetical protein